MFQGFTGITQEYERPEAPELVVKTVGTSIEESTLQVVRLLEANVSIVHLTLYPSILCDKEYVETPLNILDWIS